MYSAHNKGKSVVAERFKKQNQSQYISMYISKLDNIVNKYNNTYHRTIKMNPVDVKSSTYADFDKKNNKEDLNL